jgi:hypothetical protein
VNSTGNGGDANLANPSALDASGNTTLRAALEQGNNDGGDYIINFSSTVFPAGTVPIIIVVGGGKLVATANFTINGPTNVPVELSPVYLNILGQGLQRFKLMQVFDSSTSTINNISFVGGLDPADSGGGIKNEGILTLNGCTVKSCQAGIGGGIFNNKELWLNNCSVTQNEALSDGGGIATAALSTCSTHLYITTVTSNTAGGTAQGKGGGIELLANAVLTVEDGSVSDNTAYNTGIGGGIYSSGGTVTLTNCPLSGNTAGNGGGLYCATGTATLDSVTVADNTASLWGGGFYAELGSTVNLTGTTTFSGLNQAGSGGPKAAYAGVLNATVWISIGGSCVGIDTDLIQV